MCKHQWTTSKPKIWRCWSIKGTLKTHWASTKLPWITRLRSSMTDQMISEEHAAQAPKWPLLQFTTVSFSLHHSLNVLRWRMAALGPWSWWKQTDFIDADEAVRPGPADRVEQKLICWFQCDMFFCQCSFCFALKSVWAFVSLVFGCQ